MEKNKEGKVEEIIDLTPFYESIAYALDVKEKKQSEDGIFSLFEREFGRPLSPMEFEIINRWLDNNINEELIQHAVKEAIFNDSFTLRYVDAILNEWAKKGFKTSKEVDLYLKKKKQPKIRKNEDFFDYNWLDDEE